jgi:hypothetical protein
MNNDVFLAILAMDSYNRGPGANINGLTGEPAIGTARFVTDSVAKLGPGSQNSGFYATAYTWNGETVISYRGTNFSQFGQFLGDLISGWSTFDGLFPPTQATLAQQFYTSVTGAGLRGSAPYQAPANDDFSASLKQPAA